MAAPSQQGIPVGGYYPSLSEYEYGLKHANLLYVDNYAKYFKPLGIRRYEMMKIMPFMMNSDVLVGLDKLEYLDEASNGRDGARDGDPPVKLEDYKVSPKDSSFIDSIEFSVVKPDISGFSDKQKGRIDVEGLTRWFLKINHKKGAIDEKLLEDINDVVVHKNKLPIKYLKCIPELCSYISQKSRIAGDKQDIREASVIIEPLHNDMFNMVIPHIPINQSLEEGTKVVLSVDIPFKGKDSVRRFLWSSNLTFDSAEGSIKKNNSKSIYVKPWLDKTHICSMDLGSSIKAKFSVEKVDTQLQQSYQIFTFRREADDNYFELGMYFCYNMTPTDLIKMMLEVMPNNAYLKEVLKHIK